VLQTRVLSVPWATPMMLTLPELPAALAPVGMVMMWKRPTCWPVSISRPWGSPSEEGR